MKSLAIVLLASVFCLAAGPRVRLQQGAVPSVSRITCYVEVDADTKSDVITDFSQMDYLDIAFTNPTDTGLLFPPGMTALIKNAHAHQVKVLATIGGKDWPHRLKNLIAADQRTQFIQQIKAFLDKHCFDGVDIDFEGHLVDSDFEPFVRALSAALKTNKENKEVTLAVGGDDFMKKGENTFHIPADFWKTVDIVNTMSYDSTGKSHPKHQDASYSYATLDLARWLSVMSVPKDKIGLGLPFYGSYGKELGFNFITSTYHADVNADSVILQNGDTIYYNGLNTIRMKTQYACTLGIKGIMVWQVVEDIPGDSSLLTAINKTIRDFKPAKQ